MLPMVSIRRGLVFCSAEISSGQLLAMTARRALYPTEPIAYSKGWTQSRSRAEHPATVAQFFKVCSGLVDRVPHTPATHKSCNLFNAHRVT
jgi:hypothetical protein